MNHSWMSEVYVNLRFFEMNLSMYDRKRKMKNEK